MTAALVMFVNMVCYDCKSKFKIMLYNQVECLKTDLFNNATFIHHGLEMIVVLSRFTIANDMAEEVRFAFRQRPHLVDEVPGFLGMEVMSPIGNPAEVWLFTRWRDEQSYSDWHKGHEYLESQKGIPKELKLVPVCTEIKLMAVFAE